MKEIVIHLDNGESIHIKDDCNDELETYSLELSKILESTNVVNLDTTEKTLIIRPTRIDAIEVKEIQPVEESEICIPKSNEINEEEEDIIVDGD